MVTSCLRAHVTQLDVTQTSRLIQQRALLHSQTLDRKGIEKQKAAARVEIATVKAAFQTHQSFQIAMPDDVWRFLPLDSQANGASRSSFHQAPQLSSLKLRNLRGQV